MISDRLKIAEEKFKANDRLGYINYRIQALFNQAGYGLMSRAKQQELRNLMQEKETLEKQGEQ